ncbi:MAG: soluble lytic murein transglycosylase [Gammaproteobacteria bacterium]|jgi:soluble lytic murein transglycosylase
MSKSAQFNTSLLVLYSWLLLLSGLIANTASANFERQRVMFHDASLALERGQIKKFNRIYSELGDYPAKAYLQYDHFRKRINSESPQRVEKFLERYAEYPFEYHARGKWLVVLAKKQDWENYLRFFDARENTELKCLSFNARLKLNRTENINEDISRMWDRGYSQPSECDSAFAHFLQTTSNPDDAIWKRIEKAFKARRPQLARYLGKKLSVDDQRIVERWYRAHQRPEKSLVQLAKAKDLPRNRAIVVHAIDRLARKNSIKALKAWEIIEPDFAFDAKQIEQIKLRIALSAAYQLEPIAGELLSGINPEIMNDKAYLWLARIQLRNQDWQGLVTTIKRMPGHLHQENQWQYWLSRGMEEQGQLVDSMSLLESLAGKSSYYGFLASDKLKLGYQIEQENVSALLVDEDQFLASNPNMLRARELYFLNRLVDAKREWFQALRQLDQTQIKQAATLASKWKWHDSAIRTVAKTPHRRDYSLRFPTPYKDQVLMQAQKNQLDASLIYGVMRRESLFDPKARSSVGALGLMQLMPRTARGVANSMGLKKPQRADILQVSNNINMGSYYLKSVMNRFDGNVALAAAAYNAGPSNVKRWLPRKGVMAADLWVETVPFTETRNYVQAVLAYSTVFDKKFGNKTLMSSRMRDVKPTY